MAERRERTPEEREAARLERARRRAARRGEPPPQPEPQPAPTEAAMQQREPEPVSASTRASAPPPVEPPAPHQASETNPLMAANAASDGAATERELDVGEHDFETGEYELGTGEHDLETGEYEAGTGQHDVETGEYQLATDERDLETGEHDLDTGEHDLDTGEHDLDTGGRDLETGEQDLETGEQDLESGEQDLESGEHDLDTGEHELELPSGTRRVSARDARPVPPPLPPRKRRKKQKSTWKPRKSAGKPREGRRVRLWLVRIASLVALALAAAVIWFLIEVFQPFGTSPHGRVRVTIPPRATSDQIGDLLEREGVISSSFFFGVRATLDGDRSHLRSGFYNLQLDMSYGSVLKTLTKVPPAAKVTEITITEGQRRKQIDQLLHAQQVRASYLAATRSTKLLNLRSYGLRHKPPSLEGFLFPDTYQLVEPIRVQALVDDQLRTFKKQFAKVNLDYARRHHLTPYDVLIIASLIEAETPTAHDRPMVSSVIYNRLADGMMLQLDATTQYATGNFTRPLTVSQLHSRSPYNTRTHLGLPPTPIDNPGMASIQAAAHPAHTKYLFFIAKPCRRGSVFVTNYSQFLNLDAKYQHRHC